MVAHTRNPKAKIGKRKVQGQPEPHMRPYLGKPKETQSPLLFYVIKLRMVDTCLGVRASNHHEVSSVGTRDGDKWIP